MVDRIAQHRHCKNCDKAIPYKDNFCDENCEKDWTTKRAGEKKRLLYFYGLMVAVFVLAIVFVFL